MLSSTETATGTFLREAWEAVEKSVEVLLLEVRIQALVVLVGVDYLRLEPASHPIQVSVPGSAVERREDDFNGFRDFYLNNRTRI